VFCLPDDFPCGVEPGGMPKDVEVAEILREDGALLVEAAA